MENNLDFCKYIDHDYLENLFQKYLAGHKVSTQDITLSIKGVSRFRPDMLIDKVADYVLEMRRKQVYLHFSRLQNV